MSTVRLKNKSPLNEQMVKSERLVFRFGIDGNATPALKTYSSDIGDVALLRAQGQTAAVDAIETLTWTAPSDNTAGDSVFGIYINMRSSVTPSLGPVAAVSDFADRVYSVQIVDQGGTATSLAVSGPNAVANAYLTPLGNIAIEISATGLNLAAEDATLNVLVDYREALG